MVAAVALQGALMPDAHLGMGATVGSVIPTKGAIIPAAVGVDIGCGMMAHRTSLTGDDLPESLVIEAGRAQSTRSADRDEATGSASGRAGAGYFAFDFIDAARRPRVQEVAQAHQSAGLVAGDQFVEPREVVLRGAVRHGLAQRAVGRRLAQVQVGHEQRVGSRPPKRAFGQQVQAFTGPIDAGVRGFGDGEHAMHCGQMLPASV